MGGGGILSLKGKECNCSDYRYSAKEVADA